MSGRISPLEHFIAKDVGEDIRAYEQTLKGYHRTGFDRFRDCSAYVFAYIQRYFPPAVGFLGLEEIVMQGSYEGGAVKLAAAASLVALDRYMSRIGTNVSRAHAVVDYLTGKDVREYVEVYEPLVRKMTHRGALSKGMEYWMHFRIFLFRFGFTYVEIDGVMNLFNGEYIRGLTELGIGIYKNFADYRAMLQRKVWLNFYEEVAASGAVPHLTDTNHTGQPIKTAQPNLP